MSFNGRDTDSEDDDIKPSANVRVLYCDKPKIDENDDAIYVQKDKAESFESGILESRYEELSEEDNKRIDDLIAEINSNCEE